ncbi:hypothetical protein Pcinc_036631 [Petrolisthes cinctipes]|uniref:Uncharacterized protein n=1 Tax=Petrolisthes cinctipes TaxID=88211 RepID=A0AAE1EPF9_PETCI|nr:hypothetical protein Pcinc_036631 [Petrolisthes cinctipes]
MIRREVDLGGGGGGWGLLTKLEMFTRECLSRLPAHPQLSLLAFPSESRPKAGSTNHHTEIYDSVLLRKVSSSSSSLVVVSRWVTFHGYVLGRHPLKMFISHS